MFNSRRYNIELAATFGFAIITTLFFVNFYRHNPESPWVLPVAIIPALPMVLMAIVMLREMLRLDELQRKIALLTLGITCAITWVFSYAYWLLELAGFTHLSSVYVFAFMSQVFWVTLRIVRWKYK